MIIVVNNIKYLKENSKSFIDSGTLINRAIKKKIEEKIIEIKSLNLEQDAEITINGDVNSFSFDVSSKDSETIKLIREKLNF
jgi:hypothetical protein